VVERCDEWHHCYNLGWKGVITPESFAHPAKISRELSNRIYTHALSHGWLHPGDLVVDPFGGIGGTALGAMARGCRWIGVELEPKFVTMGRENLALFERSLHCEPDRSWLLQGDSRRLAQVLAPDRPSCVVSSPPYAGIQVSAGNVGNAINERWGKGQRLTQADSYGVSDGQLGNMREGQAPALVVSSPPYAGIATGAGGLNTKPGKDGQQSGRSAQARSQDTDQRYGSSAGQLAVMSEGNVDAVVSSPPFERSLSDAPSDAIRRGVGASFGSSSLGDGYGSTDGQIGAESGETFWKSAAEIVAQCHQILRPGGVAIWITKDFVRKGKVVNFSDQWQALCESRGFVTLCRHRAMLVEHHGEQDDLFGETKVLKTERKSFFRRLHESKEGAVRIDWEDVICVRKPL
jgi:hypothetical protein